MRSAECGVRSAECGVRSAECRKCGVWKMRSVENAECGKCKIEQDDDFQKEFADLDDDDITELNLTVEATVVFSD